MSFAGLYNNPRLRLKQCLSDYAEIRKGQDIEPLTRCFDAAQRIVSIGKLPRTVLVGAKKIKLHELLGIKIFDALKQGKIRLGGASFDMDTQRGVDFIIRALAEIDPSLNLGNIQQKNLVEARLLVGELKKDSWTQKHLASYYDTTSPIQYLRSLGTLLEFKILKIQARATLESMIEKLEKELKGAEKLVNIIRQGVERTIHKLSMLAGKRGEVLLALEQETYDVIASEVREGMNMEDEGSESLILKIVGPNGEMIVPLMYTVVDKSTTLERAPIEKLRPPGTSKEGAIVCPTLDPLKIERFDDGEGNKFWSTREGEEFSPRRDFVVVIEKDGTKILYRKVMLSGNDLLERLGENTTLPLKQLFKDQPNAAVELQATTFMDAELSDGELIPTVLRGTKLETVAHNGARPWETAEKVAAGRKLQQEIYEKTVVRDRDGNIIREGIIVPLAEHPAERTFGIIGEAFVKPYSVYIEDADAMVNSRKPHFTINEAMRKAAAGVVAVLTGGRIKAGEIPQTFSAESANPQVDDYIGISAVLEVPSPGITPANIDRTVLQTRVRNGKLYADLAGQLAILVSEEKKKEAIMRLMIPDFMREPLERGDLEVLKGGFKNVSVGFIDLKNSTALSRAFAERGAADDYNRLLSLLFEAMGEETKRMGLGCCFLKYIGDCIMFVVGVPYAAKSDHGNSLRMATAMKRAALKLNSDPRAQNIYAKHRDLFVDETGKANSARFCTGIASGEVFAGDILRREIDYRAILTGQFFVDKPIVIDVMGNAANLAARLEGVAGAWEMVVDMRTIEGAREEGSLQEILDKDNKYCSDITAIRDKLLIPYYKANGIDYNLQELNEKLEEYKKRFAENPFTEYNRTTPFVAQGKGTGIERVVYYHWDTRPRVLRLLREVDIITPEDNGEITPPSIKDILAKEYSTELIDKGKRSAIIDLVKRIFAVEIALPNGNVLAKLKAYTNFVGIERLRAEAQLIEDPATRERVLKNLETATRT